MRSHEKAHCNDFQDHFHSIDKQEYEINCLVICSNKIVLFIQRQEEAVNDNDEENESIEPWINSNNLNNSVSEWVCNRKAAKRHSCIVLLLIINVSLLRFRISWHSFLHCFCRFDSELAKGESSDLNIKRQKS